MQAEIGELTPPLPLCKIVGSPTQRQFAAAGADALRLMRDRAGLRPTARVLEVGCGCGRVAIPLTGYLTGGSYDGFDVVPELVQWAREHITPRHARFRFQHVDLHNDFYNPTGRGKAQGFVFPYDAGAFDFIVLNSVFTHLLYADVRHYLREMARTLAHDGKALMSFFILNAASEQLLRSGSHSLSFRYRRFRGVRLENPSAPAAAVAYPETVVRALLAGAGFAIEEPVLFGSWCGRKNGVSFQDYVLVRKAPGAQRQPPLWRRVFRVG